MEEVLCYLSKSTSSSSAATTTTTCSDDDGVLDDQLRRGPWTPEEDSLLVHYISCHGEGRWNLLAKRSGLKRTGKSCRLRWLNYLKPEVKRGNLSSQEQLLILELHSKWGNRWSKIAQYLPGRTDNEIKNYWRTRVQKQARHLKIDPNSREFEELIRSVWIPMLLQKVQLGSNNPFPESSPSPGPAPAPETKVPHQNFNTSSSPSSMSFSESTKISSTTSSSSSSSSLTQVSLFLENPIDPFGNNFYGPFQDECYNVDSTNMYDVETLNSVGPVTRLGCSVVANNSTEQNNWLMMSDDMEQYSLWSNLDEFWQVKQPKARNT